MKEVTTIRELIDELWVLLFVFMKAVMVSVTSVLYAATLFFFVFTRHLFLGTKYLYENVKNWNPIKPEIFEFKQIGEENEIS